MPTKVSYRTLIDKPAVKFLLPRAFLPHIVLLELGIQGTQIPPHFSLSNASRSPIQIHIDDDLTRCHIATAATQMKLKLKLMYGIAMNATD